MENLDRLVAETLAQNGFEPPVYMRPIQWSRWFRCESSFSLLLVPSAPGLYALAEEIAGPGESLNAKRMLAVFDVGETDDLCITLSRQFSPRSPLNERLASGRCFVRFAQLRDAERRRIVCTSLKRWLTASAQTATGLGPDSSTNEFGIGGDFAKSEAARQNDTQAMSSHAAAVRTSSPEVSNAEGPELAAPDQAQDARPAACGDEPPPLPSGF